MIQKQYKKYIPQILIFLFVFSLIIFIFKSLFQNITTNLADWNDYPLYIWILYQNISHITALSFSEFFNGNIFYPDQGTLLLSDLFIPQSLLALIVSRFTSNPILTFNIIYFTSWALNIISAQYLWSRITKKNSLIFFGTLVTTISSYTLVNAVHFQMINYWPYLFGVGMLLNNKIDRKNGIFTALWITMQFYSGVYLGFFMLFTLALWYLSQVKAIFTKKYFHKYLNHFSTILLLLLILVGPLLYNYYLVKQQYNAIRDYSEYVQYSMHLTDYLFPAHLSSLIGNLKVIRKWASFNHASGIFPGFVISITALFGFFSILKIKKNKAIAHIVNKENLFFTLLLFIGLIFSLGPRLNINGLYTQLPLPYTFLLKFIPGFDIIRVNTRWSWLFYIGITYYSIMGFEKFSKKTTFVVIFATLLFLIEIVPLNKLTTSKDYYSYEYSHLEDVCNEETILLEYPMTQDKDDVDIVTNLTYRTQMMMATVHHKCGLVNGYTGYIPRDYSEFESKLFKNVENDENIEFFEAIEERGGDIIKLNKNDIFDYKSDKIDSWLKSRESSDVIFSDDNHTILKLSK